MIRIDCFLRFDGYSSMNLYRKYFLEIVDVLIIEMYLVFFDDIGFLM